MTMSRQARQARPATARQRSQAVAPKAFQVKASMLKLLHIQGEVAKQGCEWRPRARPGRYPQPGLPGVCGVPRGADTFPATDERVWSARRPCFRTDEYGRECRRTHICVLVLSLFSRVTTIPHKTTATHSASEQGDAGGCAVHTLSLHGPRSASAPRSHASGRGSSTCTHTNSSA